MKAHVTYGLLPLLALWLMAFPAFAQDDAAPVPEPNTQAQQQPPPRQSRPAFTQQELDQMLAPIALYPDSLLSQILMAATYPLEVIEAARWSKANPNIKGEEAVQAVQQNSWDPSVKSLVAFPQILAMMDEKLNWMERLGDAFLGQQQQVMDTIQQLRQRAYDAGNLASNDKVHVNQQGQTIVVEPANPQTVYVPYYDPWVIYGPWWWPSYPPVFWAPWPGYFIGPGFSVGFAWGFGVPIRAGFFFGAFDWPRRLVNIGVVNNFFITNNAVRSWQHEPFHRRGIPYRDMALSRQFGRTSASPDLRRDFRGHDQASFGRSSWFDTRSQMREAPGRQPGERGSFGRQNIPNGRPPDMRSAPFRPTVPNGLGRPHVEPQPHAFEGVGHGADVRNFSARGHASSQGFGSRSFGGGHHGGGGGHR